jgi:hypothetical protein
MPRYSVYDYTRHAYDYYEAPGPGGTHAGSPPKPSSIADLGASPERASWKLPVGAHKVGSGAVPQGRIASLDGADAVSDPTTLIVFAVAAYIGWRMFR